MLLSGRVGLHHGRKQLASPRLEILEDMDEAEREAFLAKLPPHSRQDPDVLDIVWSLQELRVSLFAQRLGTAGPISAKRIYAAMDAAEDASAP